MSIKLTFAILAICVTVAGAALADDEPTVGDPELASPFFPVNDNSISYHYEFSATNPGAGTTGKNVLSFTHFDVWAYGTNFVNVDWLKATNGTATPAAPCGFPNANTGCSGYTEPYGLWRGTLGWNQLFNTKIFGAGPLNNVAFLMGVDLNADNTTLWSRKRSIEGGLQFEFEAPYNGFLNAGFVAYKEWQHDGIASSLGTADYSSYLIQAQASGAKVIGLANAGTDLQNCIKQAAEFGITKGGARLATLLMIINDVVSLGQNVCQGLVLTNSFYWDMSPETRTWTQRYLAKMQSPPNEYNAGCYAGVLHWLKAVKAVNTLDADAVAANMHETPLDDFYNKNVRIQANGCVPHTMYLWQVKAPSQSNGKFDLFTQLATMPSPEAFPPPGLFGCPLVPS